MIGRASRSSKVYLEVEVGRLLESLRGLAESPRARGLPAAAAALAWLNGEGGAEFSGVCLGLLEYDHDRHEAAEDAHLITLESQAKRLGAALEAAMRSGGAA